MRKNDDLLDYIDLFKTTMKKTACLLSAVLSISMIPSTFLFAAEETDLDFINAETAEVMGEFTESEDDLISETTEDGDYAESIISEPETGEEGVQEEEQLLTDGHNETAETVEPSGQATGSNAVTSEVLEADFVKKAFDSEEAAVTSRSGSSVLVCDGYGILFVEYETEGEIEYPVSAYKWSVSDKWYSVDSDGNSSILGAGSYRFYGDTEWMIGANGTGYGGYVVNNGSWSYFLGVSDISNGYAEGAGFDGTLPAMLYHGAKWTADIVSAIKGGLHNYAGCKYYMLKDRTVLTNGKMKVGDCWYEFGEDGTCVHTYKNNYWKQERLGYYVRVDENGNIIRTAGFYNIDGNTYFLCGNSGRRVQGWLSWKGGKYYFDPDTGVQVIGKAAIDGVPYFFNPDSPIPGKMVNNANIFVDGKRYFFRYQDGELVTGWIMGGADGSHKYYVNADGSLKLGWSRIPSEYRTYYFETKWGYALKGFQTIDGNRYLFVPGSDAVGRGWITIGSDKYYCDPKTAVLTTGFSVINGKHYYFDGSGKLVKNEKTYEISGKYYDFDKNGNYTEVVLTEVQKLARDRLDQIGWDLRSAYDWAVMLYVRLDDSIPTGYEPADYYGLRGLKYHSGNCYTMAATFYQLAIQLGYDAHLVFGYIMRAGGGVGDHGWVEIDEPDGTYVYDPDFEYDDTYNTFRANGFRIQYGQKGTWRYVDYHRVN